MIRARTQRIVVLVMCAAAILAAAAVAPSAPARERLIGVAGSVERISADDGLVAISSHLESAGLVCDRAAAWRPANGVVVRFGRPGQCRREGGSSDDAVVDLYFAGGRAVFTSYSYGNHAYCNAVRTATIDDPKPSRVANVPCSGGSGDADQFFEFAGSGSLIAVASYVHCYPGECGGPEGHYDVALWRLAGARLVKLAGVANRSRLLAAEAGRIAVLAPDGAIVLYSASGKALRTLAFEKREVLDARLSGSQLVVQTRQSIEVFDAAKGTLERTRAVTPAAKLKDVEGGLAVYVRGRTIYVLRLSDGADRAYAGVTGLVGVELERSGLFYAYNERKGAKPGRVAFVPSADLAKLWR
jgi:hypothetical protein